jgi:hypothetical protein
VRLPFMGARTSSCAILADPSPAFLSPRAAMQCRCSRDVRKMRGVTNGWQKVNRNCGKHPALDIAEQRFSSFELEKPFQVDG